MISSLVRALIAALKARPELALGKVALRASGDSGFSPTSAGSRFPAPFAFSDTTGSQGSLACESGGAMATTNKVKGWTGVLMTEDSSSHWPSKRRHVNSETSPRARPVPKLSPFEIGHKSTA